jgi:hypothetical protein
MITRDIKKTIVSAGKQQKSDSLEARKAENEAFVSKTDEMRIFLTKNPVPKEFLK